MHFLIFKFDCLYCNTKLGYMNPGIIKLNAIAKKQERLIIGLMSGTSLDGLDIALCKIEGFGKSTQITLLAYETISYPSHFKNELKQICFVKNVDLEQICLLNKGIGTLHAQWINSFLKRNHYEASNIDLIASHGQTIYHSPASLRVNADYGNATLQIGDGDQIAVETGVITLSDFRQKNIAQGEEGAPLALYGDYLLFANQAENRILLNIGGISNFTLLPNNATFADTVCTDLGPGNTLMDRFIQKHFEGKHFDEDANVASAGKFNQLLIDEMFKHPFFKEEFPKSTGPELFNLAYLAKASAATNTNNLSLEDTMASLNRFTALCIAKGINQYFTEADEPVVYVSGGGVHNPVLLANLKEIIPYATFKDTSTLGINPDAKEAILFALLANETVAGDYSVFNENTLSMGKISFPN